MKKLNEQMRSKMKRLLLVALIVLVMAGCEVKYTKEIPKRALADTISINLKTGLKIHRGWEEVRILEEKGMVNFISTGCLMYYGDVGGG